MRFLLSNDDGYLAPGLACLARALAPLGHLDVVAPERDRSGASNSLTLDRPLRVRRGENGFDYVDGTPTDCVHLAITGLVTTKPDMVIAGINRGANLGDDVLYSGTVAAAMEGRFLGVPAIAVSLASHEGRNFDTAADIVVRLVHRLCADPLPANTILNVNVPDAPMSEITGIEATRLGHRHQAEPVVRAADPHGNPVYWVGAPGAEADAGPGTDFHAVRQQRVSITPLHVDLTRYTALEQISSWLKNSRHPAGMTPVNTRRGIGMTSARTRERLLQQLRDEGIHDERVLQALRDVPRHLFIDEALASRAYENTALPIGYGQTISQPYIVARMTEALLADHSGCADWTPSTGNRHRLGLPGGGIGGVGGRGVHRRAPGTVDEAGAQTPARTRLPQCACQTEKRSEFRILFFDLDLSSVFVFDLFDVLLIRFLNMV